jgi:predicted amidophosphoribosyltransferase
MTTPNTKCPICQLPVTDNRHICHLCKAAGRDLRFDSGQCEAEHMSKAHTVEEIEHFDAAQTIVKK